MNGYTSPWSDNSVAILRDMWEGGASIPDIAKKLKKTRSAVIGKSHRLGLSLRRPNAQKNFDAELLAKLWNEKATKSYIQYRLHCSREYLERKILQLKLKPRLKKSKAAIPLAQSYVPKPSSTPPQYLCSVSGCGMFAMGRLCYAHGCGEVYV